MTKQEKYEEALKQLQWKLKTAKNWEHEEVVFESILIIDRALEEE